MANTGEQGREAAFREMKARFAPLFWDTEIDRLDMQGNRRLIISRLLSMGGMPGFVWVKDHYSAEDIADAAIHRRDMDWKVRCFICDQYGIPRHRLISTSPHWR